MRAFPLLAAVAAELFRAGPVLAPLAVALAVAVAVADAAAVALLAPILAASGLAGGGLLPPWLRLELGLEPLLALWLGCVAVSAAGTAWREVAVRGLRQRIEARLMIGLHDAMLTMEWSAFQAERGSDLVAAMSHHAARIGQGTLALSNLAARGVLMAVQAVLAMAVAKAAVAVAVGAALVLVLTHVPRARLIQRHGKAAADDADAFHATMARQLDGMKLAKTHRAEAGFHAAFRRVVDRWGDSQRAMGGAVALSRLVGRLLMALLLVVLVWAAVRHGNLSAPELAVLVGVAVRLLPAFGDTVHLAHMSTEMLPSWQALAQVRARLRRGREAAVPPAADLPGGDLVLEDVGFVWPGRDRPAVAGVSLTLPAGRLTALVGPSGGGKTTLADLCTGLLLPAWGRLSVGGVALEGAVREAWRRQVAYVPQDGFLMAGSVRDNLTWLAPGTGEDALWRALAQTAMDDVVRRLPRGLDTELGDGGGGLSGGERQRLALARALLSRPRLLVLDEAASHLDHAAEAVLRRVLAGLRGGVTVLAIAHRLDTARDADRVVVMADGLVREQGTWAELARDQSSWLFAAAAIP